MVREGVQRGDRLGIAASAVRLWEKQVVLVAADSVRSDLGMFMSSWMLHGVLELGSTHLKRSMARDEDGRARRNAVKRRYHFGNARTTVMSTTPDFNDQSEKYCSSPLSSW